MNHSLISRRSLGLLTLLLTGGLTAQAQHIGVGTLDPKERLDVVGGNVKITTAGSKLIFPDGTSQGTAATTATGAGFIQNTTTQQASSNFNISGSGTVGTGLVVDNANGNTGTTANFLRFGASGSGEGIGSKRNVGGNVTGLDFYTASAARLSITNGGNVGIGTSAPGTRLDVVGLGNNSIDLRVNGRLRTGDANNGGGVWLNEGQSQFVGQFDATKLGIYNGDWRLVVDNAGRVGIGTSDPQSSLEIRSAGTVAASLTTTADDPNGVLTINVPTTNTQCNTCTELIQFTRPGTGIGSISMTSNSLGVAYNTTSDKRLKENIARTRFGLADLLKLEVKDYHFIGQPTAARSTGFLAQDLFKVYPDAVKEGDYGTTVTNQWGVDYGKLTPLLVQAIQDQQKLIDRQQAELNDLKTQNAALQTGSAADHASLLTLQAQMARLLGEGAQARK